jgi:hypothetical protein
MMIKNTKSFLGADIGNVGSPFYSVGQWIKLIAPGMIDSTALRAIECRK